MSGPEGASVSNSAGSGLPSFFPNVSHLLGGHSTLPVIVSDWNQYLAASTWPQLGHVAANVERYEQLQQASHAPHAQASNVPPTRTAKQLENKKAALTGRLKAAAMKLAEKNVSRKMTRLQNENAELAVRLERTEKRLGVKKASLKEARQEIETLSDKLKREQREASEKEAQLCQRITELSERVAELEKDGADRELLLETVCNENEDLISDKISNEQAQRQMHVQQYQLGDLTIQNMQAAEPHQQHAKQQAEFLVQSHAEKRQTLLDALHPYETPSTLHGFVLHSPQKPLFNPSLTSSSANSSEEVVAVSPATNGVLRSRSGDDDDIIVIEDELDELFVTRPLQVLLFNILVLYMGCSICVGGSFLWLQIRYLTVKEPCDLLVPIWIPILMRGWSYVYTISFPFWHLAMTMERCWATLRPSTYENASMAYGVIVSAIVWIIGLWYAIYAVFLAFEDPTFRDSVYYITMTTKTNAEFLAVLDIPRLAVDVATTIVDTLLVIINRRKLRRISDGYSLGRNYQLKENVLATERFVLPCSVCNALLYVAFLSVLTYLHDVRYTIGALSYYSALEWLSLLVLVQPPISLCILVYFCRHSRRKVEIVEQSAECELYFNQFRAMLESAASMPERTPSNKRLLP